MSSQESSPDPKPKHRGPSRRIGLTGGIATGKTTVANHLAKYQLPVLDADVYAREAVQPNSLILARIVEHFGQKILLPDGGLNRQKLGNLIFNNSQQRQWLEAQIHPYVRDRLLGTLASLLEKSPETSPAMPVVVVVIPLLFEAKMTDLVNEIWVVTCSLDQQLERLRQRNGLTQVQAQARINAQMPLADKVAQATVVLDNSSTLEHLQQQVETALANHK